MNTVRLEEIDALLTAYMHGAVPWDRYRVAALQEERERLTDELTQRLKDEM